MRNGRSLGGWSVGECYVVLGVFLVVKSVLEGAVGPSLLSVVEKVRRGSLDLVLVKPKNALFLVSTARFYPANAVGTVFGAALIAIGFRTMGRWPGVGPVLVGFGLLLDGLVLLYALLVFCVCAAFYAVRVDNLTFLLGAIFDAARWPRSAFRGAVRFVFTFVLPIVVMTSLPAEALVGRIGIREWFVTTMGTGAFLAAALFAWHRSVRAYTSAGG
jgi:ABC-2 type transport system permease protein